MSDFYGAFTWYPAHGGDPVLLEFDRAMPFAAIEPEGLLDNLAVLSTRKTIGQKGTTLERIEVDQRLVTMQIGVNADSREHLRELRRRLARAFAVNPTRPGQVPLLGVLRLEQTGQPPMQIFAAPNKIVAGERLDPELDIIDVEFLCPDPDWQGLTAIPIDFAGTVANPGFTTPVTLPLTSNSLNFTREIFIEGTADTPVIMRIYGDCTGAEVILNSTGEKVRVRSRIPAGYYVEVDTQWGRKRAEYVNATTEARTPALNMLDLDVTTLWYLRSGVQTVTFQAGVNPSGTLRLLYTPRYSGV